MVRLVHVRLVLQQDLLDPEDPDALSVLSLLYFLVVPADLSALKTTVNSVDSESEFYVFRKRLDAQINNSRMQYIRFEQCMETVLVNGCKPIVEMGYRLQHGFLVQRPNLLLCYITIL